MLGQLETEKGFSIEEFIECQLFSLNSGALESKRAFQTSELEGTVGTWFEFTGHSQKGQT